MTSRSSWGLLRFYGRRWLDTVIDRHEMLEAAHAACKASKENAMNLLYELTLSIILSCLPCSLQRSWFYASIASSEQTHLPNLAVHNNVLGLAIDLSTRPVFLRNINCILQHAGWLLC